MNLWEGLQHVTKFCAVVTFSVLLLCANPAWGRAFSVEGVIESASEIDYPPYCLVDSNGAAAGFSVDLLRATIETMGHEVTFTTGPWSEVKQSLIDGRVRVLPLVGRTPEREKVFDFTFPYLTMHGAIIVRRGETGIGQLSDLSGKKLAVMRGDNAEEFVRRQQLGAEIVPTPTFVEALQGLAEGEYDAVVMQRLLFYQLADRHGFTSLAVAGSPLEEFRQSFCFAVRKGDHELLQHLNEGLALVMANGEFARLYRKWIAPLENLHVSKSRIVVGGDDNYPPYEYLDDYGQPAGYNVELTRAIAREMGVDVDIRLRPWSQTREALAAGELDLIQGMFYSSERDREFDFGPPHTVVSHVMVGRKGEPLPASLADLAGKRVAVMRGDIIHDMMLEQGIPAELLVVDSQEQVLRLVNDGASDIGLSARIPALYWIARNGWAGLEVDDQSLASPEYCYAARHESRALLEKFTEGLAGIKSSGEYRRIYARTLGEYDDVTTRRLKSLAMTAVVLGGVLALVLVWTVLLRGQVKQRTRELEVEVQARQQLLQQVLEREQAIKLILNSTAEGIYGVNASGECTFFNAAAERMLGYEFSEVTGRRIHDLIAHTDEVGRRTGGCRLDHVFHNRKPLHFADTILWKRNGEWLNVELLIQPLGGDGCVEGAVVTFRDISEQKKVIEQRIRSGQLSSLGELAAGIAHEINNPVGGVINYAHILLRRKIGSEQDQKLLAGIMKEGERIASIVRNLLNFVHKDRDTMAPVDVAAMIDEPMALLARQLESNGIIVDIELQDGLPRIYGNIQKLEQVLLNLISNARHTLNEKYPQTDPNKILRITAGVVGEADNRRVRMVVFDHGCGISPERLKRVFNRFYTTKPAGVGTGLGLSIVHDILEAHGAKIDIESEEGLYTKVIIEFPVYTK